MSELIKSILILSSKYTKNIDKHCRLQNGLIPRPLPCYHQADTPCSKCIFSSDTKSKPVTERLQNHCENNV